MHPLLGPYLAVAVLVGVAGAAKVLSPRPTAGALRAAGFPSSEMVVRVLGAAELTIAILAMATGTWVGAVPLAVAYLGFAWFSWSAIRNGRALSGCGCFGRPDTPPTHLHIVVNLGAALVSAAVAVWPVGGVAEVLGGLGIDATAMLTSVAAAVVLLYALLAELPRTRSGVRGTPVRLLPRRAP